MLMSYRAAWPRLLGVCTSIRYCWVCVPPYAAGVWWLGSMVCYAWHVLLISGQGLQFGLIVRSRVQEVQTSHGTSGLGCSLVLARQGLDIRHVQAIGCFLVQRTLLALLSGQGWCMLVSEALFGD